VLVHRLKSEILNWDGTKRFPERKLEAIEVSYKEARGQRIGSSNATASSVKRSARMTR